MMGDMAKTEACIIKTLSLTPPLGPAPCPFPSHWLSPLSCLTFIDACDSYATDPPTVER